MRTIIYILICLFPAASSGQITIAISDESQPLLFGIQRIGHALSERGASSQIITTKSNDIADIRFVVDAAHPGLKAEGYRISRSRGGIVVKARDAAGAMYGALDIAEQLKNGTTLRDVVEKEINPHFSVRALKFNLPWSSYRTGEAMEQHTEICRDLKFWQSFLDQMAENRFNLLSLWNVHPFSYMVKPTNFPHANDFTPDEMVKWKHFWTSLFRMCRARGIEPFIVNWNIAVSPEFARHYDVLERNDTSQIVKRYTREVVTQVIDEYPDLAGIGITLADWMSNFRQPGSSLPEMTAKDREDWIAETVVAGIRQASRPVKFLHRSVLSADPGEMRRVIDEASLPDTTLVEIKFNWSHGHSTPRLVLTHDDHSGKVENRYWNPMPHNYRIEWMIRNEDFFILRWGQPDFVRQHIALNSPSFVNGYFVGSEGYIPAKEFSHIKNDHVTWTYAFQKQWLFYKVWGRLLYDPATPDAVFAASFADRYDLEDGAPMLKAFARASNMPLRLASFHAATWDYTLYSEGFLAPFPSNGGLHDATSSFISIDELIDHRPLDPDYVSIKDFVATRLAGKHTPSEKITPEELASLLEKDGKDVIAYLRSMGPISGALACERDDLETWGFLSLYLAEKIRAGIALHTFRLSGNKKSQEQAVQLLNQCHSYWKALSDITASHYREVPYIDDLGYGEAWRDAKTFSWKKYLPQVERDIRIATGAAHK
jgi:hypothetical protein